MTIEKFINGTPFRIKDGKSLSVVYKYDMPMKRLLDLEWGEHLAILNITNTYIVLSLNKSKEIYYEELVEV